MTRTRRAALAAALVLLVGAPPSAADAPSTHAAEEIVSTVAAGDPLGVVVTTTGPDGAPRFRTTPAASRSDARSLVRSALSRGLTVSMAQPVRVTASNDTYRSRQWALDTLRAETAWKTSKGGSSSRRVVVAVVDTGVATDHPDLRDNLVAGRDVLDPGTAPSDENGHGTHVAGIVAAVAGNGRGIAGLAPRAAVMPVRVLDADGAGSTDDVARGITWAVQHGATVVNLSLGSTRRDAALERAVAHARSRGAVVVAAAGNSGGGLGCLLGCAAQYPAAYPGVIGVGSIDANRSRSSFSTRGAWVDVVAPGGGIVSLVPRRNRIGCGTSTYCTLSGTSRATPYVSAAVALARHVRGWNGTTTADRVLSTATDLGPRGRDDAYGHGLVDPVALLGAR